MKGNLCVYVRKRKTDRMCVEEGVAYVMSMSHSDTGFTP